MCGRSVFKENGDNYCVCLLLLTTVRVLFVVQQKTDPIPSMVPGTVSLLTR